VTALIRVRRDVYAVEFVQVPGDLSGAHAAGVHRDDLVVEARKPPLIFGDELRIKARLAIPGHVQIDPARVRRHRLATIAVAAVASPVLAAEMMVHLGVQRALGQCLLQPVDQAVRIKRRLRIGARQKLVKQGVGYRRFLASGHGRSPSFPVCPPSHEIPDSPRLRHRARRDQHRSKIGDFRIADDGIWLASTVFAGLGA